MRFSFGLSSIRNLLNSRSINRDFGRPLRRVCGCKSKIRIVEQLEDRTLLSFQALLAPANFSTTANSAIALDVQYQTQNNSGTPTVLPSNGITVSTFFNSSKLTFQSVTNTLQADIFDDSAVVVNDTADLDGDPLTDKYFNMIWINGNSSFPTSTQPLRLFSANFTAASNFTGTTKVTFGGNPGANFQIKSSSVTISEAAQALPIQQLTASSTAISAAASAAVSFGVQYKTLNANGTPTALPSNGITVSTFFNSSKLTFQSVSNMLQTDLFDDSAVVVNDTNNLDGDPLTDKYFNLIWNSGAFTFPTGTQPVELFKANFTAASNFTGSTQIGFGGSPGANFKIQSTPVTVTASAAPLTVTVSSTSSETTNIKPIPVSVQFSGNVTGFTASDVVVVGGTISAFTSQSSSLYTFNIINPSQGTVSVRIPANVATTSSGQGNQAATLLTRTFDDVGPQITSASTAQVLENTLAVLLIMATDSHSPVTYSLAGGADLDKFTIDPTTGQLSFVTAPLFDSPTDQDENNTYLVQVRATDSVGNSSQKNVTITVTSSLAPPSSKIDGVNRRISYRPKSGPVEIFDGATFSVTGTEDFSKAVLFVHHSWGYTGKLPYTLGIRSTGTGLGQIQLQGTRVLYQGTAVGVLRSSDMSRFNKYFFIEFNSSATVDAIQAVIRSLTFSQVRRRPLIQSFYASFYLDRDQIASAPGSSSDSVGIYINK